MLLDIWTDWDRGKYNPGEKRNGKIRKPWKNLLVPSIRVPFYRILGEFARGPGKFVGLYKEDGEKSGGSCTGVESGQGLQKSGHA